MTKTVVLVGSLDTKGQEYAFIKELIEKEGLNTLVVDFGVMGEPFFEPDIKRDELVQAAGGDLTHLASGDHKDEAMKTMAKGMTGKSRGSGFVGRDTIDRAGCVHLSGGARV